MKKIVLIEGMMCENCANAVTKAISAVPGVLSVKVDLAGKCAEAETEGADDAAILAAVEDAGFEAKGIK